MKILLLTHRVPFPPDKGDRIRSFNIIKYLARAHTLSLMSVTHEHVHEDAYRVLREHCETVDIFKINLQIAKLKSFFYLFSRSPLTLPIFYSQEFHRAIKKKLLETKPDLIYIYSSCMAQYVLDITHVPKLMDFIDVDSQKWFDYAENASYPMKCIYRQEGSRLRSFEKRIASICYRSLFASEKELALFRSIAPKFAATAIPNGVDLPRINPIGSYRSHKLVFVGAMDYFPNVDAMIYFAKEILPLVEREVPNIELCIVGRNPARQIRALGRYKNIIVTGSIEEIKPYLCDAAASVIPLRIARGTQNKILEAMTHGVPVITTTCALQGIEAEPGRDVLVADDPGKFAERTIAVLKDKNLRDTLANNALTLIKRKYPWEEKLRPLQDLCCLGTV